MSESTLVRGIVTRHDGPRFWVGIEPGDGEGREVPCTLRGRLRQQQGRASSFLVVGDAVRLQLRDGGAATIEELEPRRSELVRPGFGGLPHVMAANVDQLVIVQATAQPPFKRRLVERFLAAARHGRMQAVIVVNKCDLEEEGAIRSRIEPLRASDVPVVLASTVDGRGIEELRELLDGKVSVMAGQSGVGKSSLINAAYPGFQARTGAVSEALNKGRHTTTASRLYPLPRGGYLADTPGIRTLGLFQDDGAASEVFPEIEAAAAGCRFRDCAHEGEPGCAVRAAVEGGGIHPDRLHNYLRFRRGE